MPATLAEPIKVNDKAGNPIMIGMVVVWSVVDTYKASFDVDNASMTSGVPGTNQDNVNAKMKAYENFVKIQSDAALRKVAGMYAYDHNTSGDEIQPNTAFGRWKNERTAWKPD